jgi:YihY family inner membrane protein
MNKIQDVLRRIDEIQQQNRVLGFIYAVVKKFGDDQAGNLAALIAYYAFFSLFPLLLAMVTILGFVLSSNPGLRQNVVNTVASKIPLLDPSQINSLHGSGIGLVVALVFTLLAGIGVIMAFENAMDEIWGVPKRKRPNFLVSRLRALIMLGILGVAALAATVVSSLSGLGGIFVLVGLVGSVALNTAILAVAFKVLTSADVSWEDVIPGAIVGGIALTILQTAGSLFVQRTLKNANRTYGQFATVIALLSWLYLGAQITIYAAEINVVKARRLWPRSITGGPTEADRSVYGQRAKTEEQRPEETVHARFDTPSRALGQPETPPLGGLAGAPTPPADGGPQEEQGGEERPATAPMQRRRSRQQL